MRRMSSSAGSRQDKPVGHAKGMASEDGEAQVNLLRDYIGDQRSKEDSRGYLRVTNIYRLGLRYARSHFKSALLAAAVVLLIWGAWVKFHNPLFLPPEPPVPWASTTGNWTPRDPPRKALILGSYEAQNVTWLEDVPDDWEIYRYINDNRTAEYHSGKVGNEANAYLTFIINHYHNLPDYMVFMHGHDRGWHQPEHSVQKVRALNLSALHDEGYLSLRCTLKPGCTENSKLHIADPHENPNDHRWMLEVLPGFMKWMFTEIEEPPEVVMAPCCAQFAATKGQVRRRSKAWWVKYRWPLVHGNIWRWSRDVWNAPDNGIGRYKVGILYEKTYHLALGKKPVYCPTEDLCHKTFFQDMIHCDGHTGNFKASKNKWENITCTATFDKGSNSSKSHYW